jgi:hypothetical protein
LLSYARELLHRGYMVPDWATSQSLTNFVKDELVEIIEAAVAPGVFGHQSVGVEKEENQMRWKVLSQQGATLVYISWHLVFEWDEAGGLTHRADLLAALEVCMILAPLDAEDRAKLEAHRPGITRKPAYLVLDAESWEAEDDEEYEIDAEFEDDPRPPTPAKPPERRTLFPTRKIKL